MLKGLVEKLALAVKHFGSTGRAYEHVLLAPLAGLASSTLTTAISPR